MYLVGKANKTRDKNSLGQNLRFFLLDGDFFACFGPFRL